MTAWEDCRACGTRGVVDDAKALTVIPSLTSKRRNTCAACYGTGRVPARPAQDDIERARRLCDRLGWAANAGRRTHELIAAEFVAMRAEHHARLRAVADAARDVVDDLQRDGAVSAETEDELISQLAELDDIQQAAPPEPGQQRRFLVQPPENSLCFPGECDTIGEAREFADSIGGGAIIIDRHAQAAPPEPQVSPDDWTPLYDFARDRLPATYRELVSLDIEIARLVRSGAELEHPRMRELVARHRSRLSVVAAVRELEAPPEPGNRAR